MVFSNCTQEKENTNQNEYNLITGENKIYSDYLIECQKKKQFYLPKLLGRIDISPTLGIEDTLKTYNNSIGFPLMYLEYKFSEFDSVTNSYLFHFNYFDSDIDIVEMEINKNDYSKFISKTKDYSLFTYHTVIVMKVASIKKLSKDAKSVKRIKGKFSYLLYSTN
jgi:hypothetical protein